MNNPLPKFILAIVCLPFLASASPAAELAESALRATVRIAQGSTSGTAFMVRLDAASDAPRMHLLVTAAHCFNNMEGERCNVIFRTPDKERGFVRKEVELTIRNGKRRLWRQHADMDVSVIALEPPEGVDLQPFEERQIADVKFAEDRRVRVGLDVCIACFPAQLEANSAGWPILRKGSIATHPLTPLAEAKTMFIDYSHFGGDSGSPVVAWIDNEPVVVGLVYAMQRQTDKSKTPFEDRTVHTPLHLAITAQAPFIRQTIEEWRKAN